MITTSQPFERHDLSTPGEGLYPEAFAQYAPPVVDKPESTIHDWEFFWKLSARMKRPLTLKYWSCGLDFDALNTASRDSPHTRRRYPVNWTYMYPDDMADDGIADGDTVRINSEFGEIIGIARAEAQLRRGVISMTHLFGRLAPSGNPLADGGSHTGRLTSLQQYLEPINFMPRFSGVPVNITIATYAGHENTT